MNVNIVKNAIAVVFLLFGNQLGISQGFMNLNFEAASISGSTQPGSLVPISSALPGWSGFYLLPSGPVQATQVAYDTISLGGFAISVNDANTGNGFVPLQGTYSAYLF